MATDDNKWICDNCGYEIKEGQKGHMVKAFNFVKGEWNTILCTNCHMIAKKQRRKPHDER